MRKWLRRRPLLGSALLFSIALLIGGAVLFVTLVKNKKGSLEFVRKELSGSLPFEVIALDLDTSLDQILKGELGWLDTQIKKEGVIAQASGPVQWKDTKLFFFPDVKFQIPNPEKGKAPFSSPSLRVELEVTLETGLNLKFQARQVEIRIPKTDWNWPEMGGRSISLKGLEAKAHLGDENSVDLKIDSFDGSLAETEDSPEKAVSLTGLHVTGTLEKLEVKAKLLSVLVGQKAWEFPLESLRLEAEPESTALRVFHQNGHTHTRLIEAQLSAPYQVEIPKTPLATWLLLYTPLADGAGWPKLDFEKVTGTVSASFQTPDPKGGVIEGHLTLKDAGFREKHLKAAFTGLDFRLPFQGDPKNGFGTKGATLELKKGYLRRLGIHIPAFEIVGQGSSSEDIDLVIPKGLKVELMTDSKIPATLEIARTQIKNSEGTSSLSLKGLSFGSFKDTLCLPPLYAVPGSLELEWKKIDFFREKADGHWNLGFEIDGVTRLKLFSGLLEVKEIAAYDVNTEAREMRFTSEWEGISLAEVGRYLNFGGMDGVLRGYAKDVVFLEGLPTRYEFLLEPKPLHEKYVTLSGAAMSNLLKTIGADVKNVQPVMHWIHFGPLRDIAGGFDIVEGGIKLTSKEGFVVIETLSSEETFKETGKHFFIRGRRFGIQIPLNSTHYPAIIDQTAFFNYSMKIGQYFYATFGEKEAKTGEQVAKASEFWDTQTSYETCQPPDI